MSEKLPVVILISGRGSNLQAILDQTHAGTLPVEIRAVISNRPDAAGLNRAQQANVHTEALDHKQFESREAFDHALKECIDQFHPELVILAGFMRILTPEFVTHYRGRMINIHPSLLPKFQGLHTHQRAIDAGETEHGASIHYVTEELDGGPVIAQSHVPVLPEDTPDSLAKRVLEREHILLPDVIRWIAQHRVTLDKNHIIFDGQALSEPVSI